MERWSIHGRLVAGVLVLVAVTTATLALMSAGMSERFLRQRFRERMEFLAHYLALNCQVGLLLDDKEGLARLAENLRSAADVVSVFIYDSKGREVVAVKGDGAGPTEVVEAPVQLHAQEEEQAFTYHGGDSELIGRVKVVYSMAGIERFGHRIYVTSLVSAILLSLVASAFFTLFARRLTKPLKGLASAAGAVAAGDLSIRVDGGFLPETRELAKAFNSMTEAIAESRRTLEETYQDLMEQRSMAEMGRFALSVAHEVKNPLGIIKGSLDILKKEGVEPSTKETMIRYVEEEVGRLDRLIREFLSFSRPKRPQFQDVDINRLVQELVAKLQVEGCGGRVSLEFRPCPRRLMVRGDTDLLSQALLNVIQNGCEAAGPDGHVVVETAMEDNNVVVRVLDDGPEPDPSLMARAFEPFVTGKAKGTGLGLAVVRRTIQQHRGQVSLERRGDGWTCCTILLEPSVIGDEV